MPRLCHVSSFSKLFRDDITTLYISRNIALARTEITSGGFGVMKLSERHWIGQGRVKPTEGAIIIYFAIYDCNHQKEAVF